MPPACCLAGDQLVPLPRFGRAGMRAA
jgi:hypothetical protein